MRGIANDLNESTNSIRLELNNLTKAGYLIKKKEKNKINYLANLKHPFCKILIELVKKHTGIELIINNIGISIKNLKSIILLGDYAKGIDSGVIQIYIEADKINKRFLRDIILKTEKKIKRKIEIKNEIDPFEDKLIIYKSE